MFPAQKMFYYSQKFNRDLSSWDVSRVANMEVRAGLCYCKQHTALHPLDALARAYAILPSASVEDK